jgi:hypothetical protein
VALAPTKRVAAAKGHVEKDLRRISDSDGDAAPP